MAMQPQHVGIAAALLEREISGEGQWVQTDLLNAGTSLIDFQVTRWFTEEFRQTHPDVTKSCVDVFLANDIPAYAATCRMLGRANLTDALSKFTMPVRIVVGEEDYATPVAMPQALQSHIAGSTLSIVPRARHLSPVEVPETIAAELIALFDTVESRAHT